MKRLALGALLLALVGTPASGQEPDRIETTLQPTTARIGDHLQLTIRLTLPPGQTPELAPGTPGWGAVELVSLEPPRQAGQEWLLRATVAPFALGQRTFTPTIAIVSGSDVHTLDPPPITITVLPTLLPDAPLELSPLPPPAAIQGAGSPFLRPALASGAALLALLLTAVIILAIRRRSPQPPAPVPMPLPPAEPALPGLLLAESTIDTDPVAAYRALAAAVRAELAQRFGIPATALTATELRARLEAIGADRWVARLAGGLLEECDAVVYAGYRPAPERRRADLAMAYELVGEP
ncbi:hypothetical protein [Tepidiforma sp.]|uniref:hypothetical protein n=1 Tax=Tepidiforma sp. TaxID=2682230 RepID=UPI002ADD8FF9|nr:hypothetical protein [Tepidiforma sp.]